MTAPRAWLVWGSMLVASVTLGLFSQPCVSALHDPVKFGSYCLLLAGVALMLWSFERSISEAKAKTDTDFTTDTDTDDED